MDSSPERNSSQKGERKDFPEPHKGRGREEKRKGEVISVVVLTKPPPQLKGDQRHVILFLLQVGYYLAVMIIFDKCLPITIANGPFERNDYCHLHTYKCTVILLYSTMDLGL